MEFTTKMAKENIIKVSEHDYATFVIKNAMAAGADEDGTIIYQIEDLGAEQLLDDRGRIELNDYEVIAANVAKKPNYRRETSVGSSGYWPEEDVHRLLRVYIKHIKNDESLRGKPNAATWNAIINEFDEQKAFSRLQIKTKMQRLRNMGRNYLCTPESTVKWPFWKQVQELLLLENKYIVDNPPEVGSCETVKWTEAEELLMIQLYKKHLGSMVKAESGFQRRLVWAKIAQGINRPRYQVSMKFQSMKAKWRRWKKSGENKKSMKFSSVHEQFNKIMAAEKIVRKQQKSCPKPEEQNEEELAKVRVKWNRDSIQLCLKKYEDSLRKLKKAGLVPTRRSIYQKVAQEMSLPWHYVQVKLVSLRNHYKKYIEKNNPRNTSWDYYDAMRIITKLENCIWNNGDSASSAGESAVYPKKIPVYRNTGELSEPEWFKQYKIEVEKRHQDRVDVLQRLLGVINSISEK